MNERAIKKACLYGIVATVVMTVCSYFSHFFHVPRTDFHALVAEMLRMGAVDSWLAYFGFGIFFAYVYRHHIKDRLPYHSWMRGIFYGFIIFLLMQLVLMPATGMGFFVGSWAGAFGMFVACALYGGTVGYLYHKDQ